MKKFFKFFGYSILTVIAVLYLAFLLVLPNAINLNKYKSDIQSLVKENTELDVDFDNPRIITTPFLEAGVKVKNVKVNLSDKSNLLTADSARAKIFLPSLLWSTIRVSGVEIDNPILNIEILNNEKFKVAKVYENFVNNQRQQKLFNPQKDFEEDKNLKVDLSKFKLNLPVVKLNNYKAVVKDLDTSHYLALKGEKLRFGYLNGNLAKLKTQAEFYSDEDKNIVADLDINTYVPEVKPSEEEVDDEAVFALPFINPVEVYRDYNLQAVVNSKLKIRKNEKDGKFRIKGFVDVTDTTLRLSGLQLPKSYFKFKARGTSGNLDANVFVTNQEFIRLSGDFDYGKKPYIDFNLKSPKVYFANVLKIARAYLDTIHIKNDIDKMTAGGYFLANAHVKTNFNEITSDGKIVIRQGKIDDANIGLLFDKINANVFFDDNVIRVSDTHFLINNRPLNFSGKIDANSIANFNIQADRISLPELYRAFAPKNIKHDYKLKSGFLTLNSKLSGEIKDIAVIFKSNLEDVLINDIKGNFVISNKSAKLGFANYSGLIRGKIQNNGFNLLLPKQNSVIKDDFMVAYIDNKNIIAKPSYIKFNNNSTVKFYGNVRNYLFSPVLQIKALGSLSSSDIETFLGKSVSPFITKKGEIPVRAEIFAKDDKAKVTLQAMANKENYITPVNLVDLENRQTIFQLMLEKSGNTLKLNKSGIFTKISDSSLSDDLEANLFGAKEIVGLKLIASNLNIRPFVNLFKITIPKNLTGSICVFKNSNFTLTGKLFAFGEPTKMNINGDFGLRNIFIPELDSAIRHISLKLNDKNVAIDLNDISADGSDFNVNIKSDLDLIMNGTLSDLTLNSRYVDVDKLINIANSANNIIYKGRNNVANSNSDIPVILQKGSVRFRKIKFGDIIANNTSGRISLYKNILYLRNLKSNPLGGNVSGKLSFNIISTELLAKLQGKDFDLEKVLLDVMKMKDTLSGNLNFIADLSLKGVTLEEQMKSLKGFADFSIKEGQLGPFGKFENFLMAENIRENAFFSSAVGSIIPKFLTVDTSHFNNLYGHITFADGIADIVPIKSQGDVMSMYISGKVNLLDNSADVKVRGKLASAISDTLGPLSNINPINLVKHTPGLNVVAVKSFALFCEEVSQEEMDALPSLEENKTDENATKFQIGLNGDTRKPLKMIKSFKWLATNSQIQSAKDFVDTIPVPVGEEENLTVEELINLRKLKLEELSKDSELEQNKKPKHFWNKFKEN